MRAYLDAVLDWLGAGEPWRPAPRWAVGAWLAFYAWFLVYAFGQHGGYLFIDSANLIVHEGGHLLFDWFGRTLCLWGGTILQWLVPLLLAAYFFYQRQRLAFTFCAFFFFENWIYTATYMADARAMELPLVTVGDPDNAGHDWNLIFSNLGLLNYDRTIATVVRALGWCGMLACVVWLAWQLNSGRAAEQPDDATLAVRQSPPTAGAASAQGLPSKWAGSGSPNS